MSKILKSRFLTIFVIAAFMFAVTPVAPVAAGVIGTEQVVGVQSAAEARATVDAFMDRGDVRAQFENLGVDPQEASERVAALSDAEVVKLADEINSSPAGQGAIGAIIGAVVLIFLVLLITDLLGLTNVFDFTNKGAVR